jgi:hypothetical protein
VDEGLLSNNLHQDESVGGRTRCSNRERSGNDNGAEALNVSSAAVGGAEADIGTLAQVGAVR